MKRSARGYAMALVAVFLLLSTGLGLPAGATTLPPLTGVRSVTTGYANSCALLTSGNVDCWGYGSFGELGNGRFYTSGNDGSAVPVGVKGVGGTGRLGGVASLISGDNGFCALLTSGNVDCWGEGYSGELGNGRFYTSDNAGSAVPVVVKGVGGTGALGDVASLTGEGDGSSYCALLNSGNVDCWGSGLSGQLGNGTFFITGHGGSAVPVAVNGVGGTGTLGGVASLTSEDSGSGYCAILTSGNVDCWGAGSSGQLGNGMIYAGANGGSAVPVAVKGVGGTGTLGGVASLTSGGDGGGSFGYCAVLTSGKADCWGAGNYGQLGNGRFYTTGHEASAVPVAVKGVGGTGTLGGVASLASEGGGSDYCALLTSGHVDCWGFGFSGDLGNGIFYTAGHEGSAVPVGVKGVGGRGTLGGVARLTGDAANHCALLTSGNVDCWGNGAFGDLGNGRFYTTFHEGSAVPVAVKGVGGTGTLGGVARLLSEANGFDYCALLTSGKVDCWGTGLYGVLGNGSYYNSGNGGSAVPVAVIT